MIDPITLEFALRLGLALLLGALLGTERIIAHKAAGVRTYALISMGAALFIIISDQALRQYLELGISVAQPTQVLAQIVVAIGFLAGGLFLKQDNHISGLTTASGLWITAGIGSAVGFGLYVLAIIATLLTLFIFTVLWIIEQKVRTVADEVLDESKKQHD